MGAVLCGIVEGGDRGGRITDRGNQIHIGGDVTGQVAIGDFVYQAHAPGGVINQIVVTEPIRALPRPVDVRPRARRGQVERTSAVADVTAAVDQEPVQIIARDGWGKTSVIAQLAYDPGIERYRDGIAVISGWGLPVEDVEQAIFDAFYESTLPDTVHKVTPGQLRTSLGNVEAAIIVDDLDVPRQHVDRLIDACAGGGFISTASTQTLWSDGTVIDLDGMNETDALSLFEQRLGRAIDGAELAAVTSFIAHIRGYPMAIVAAASAARRGSALIDMLPRLMSAPDPVAAVHEEIAATLTLAETRLLSVLAAVKGDPLPPEAVGRTAGVDGADTLLEGLRSDGLIEAASPRYRFPRSSSALLDLSVDGPATARGLAAWCDTESDSKLIAAAGPAIVSAIRSAAQDQDYAAAMALGRSADAALSLSGRWGVWGQVLDATKEAATAAMDPFVEGWSLHQLGTRALAEQRNADALDMLGRAADIRRQIGDDAGLEVTEHNLSLLNPPPAVVPPDSPPPATPPSSSGIPWWAWTMIVVGLLAIAGIAGFIVVSQGSDDPTVVTTVAVRNGELVPTTDVIEIFNVPLGESVSSEVELINVGEGSVDINNVAAVGDSSITTASDCRSLEPGGSCLVTVTFSPAAAGEFQAVLVVEHSGVNSDITIPVVGIAIDPPEAFVSVNPINLDFGVVPLGGGDSGSVEITNGGNVDVRIDDIRIDSDFFVRDNASEEDRRCASLSRGESCTIDVAIIAAEPGILAGTLMIGHTGENPPFEIRLSGVVLEPANLVIEILETSDATSIHSAADSVTTGTVTVAITNTGQTATGNAFEWRIERLDPKVEDSWIPTVTFNEENGELASIPFEGSIGPGETVIIEDVNIGFPNSDYPSLTEGFTTFTTQIRAEVDSCFGEGVIAIPPCRIAESNEEDNVSQPFKIQIFRTVID